MSRAHGRWSPSYPVDPAPAGIGDSWLIPDGGLPSDVGGIILAGSETWGEGRFEQMLRGPLLPVAHTPLIRYTIDWLRFGAVPRATICAGAGTRAARAYLADGASCGVALDYYEDREPRGPAGCARDAAERSAASLFVVVEASIIPSLDLSELIRVHRTTRAAATVVVNTDRRGRADGVRSASQPGGIYVFDRRVLEGIPARGYQDIKQGLLDRLYTAGERVLTYTVEGLTPRVLDATTYASVSSWRLSEEIRRPRFLTDYARVGEGLHHPSAVIHPSAHILGPVIIGRNVRVDADAVVIGPTAIGHDTIIGARAVVSRSTLWDACEVGEAASVDSSLVASGVSVPAHDRVCGATLIRSTMNELAAPQRLPRVAPVAAFPPATLGSRMTDGATRLRTGLPPGLAASQPRNQELRPSIELQ